MPHSINEFALESGGRRDVLIIHFVEVAHMPAAAQSFSRAAHSLSCIALKKIHMTAVFVLEAVFPVLIIID
jgi:hypothetical protein